MEVSVILVEISPDKLNGHAYSPQQSDFFHKIHYNVLSFENVVVIMENCEQKRFFMIKLSLSRE